MSRSPDPEGLSASLAALDLAEGAPVARRQAHADRPLPGRHVHDSNASEPAVHLLDYIRILYRRRWTAATVFLLVLSSTAVYILSATAVYQATSTLLIEAEKPSVVTFQEVVDQTSAADEYYQTQYKLLGSRALAAKTLDTLKLWGHPEFGEPADNARGRRGTSTILQAVPGVQTLIGGSRPQPRSSEGGETPELSGALDEFLRRLVVSPIRNTRLVEVRFRSADPALAARIANAHARAYIEQHLEFRLLASKELADWMGEQLAEQRTKVEETEIAVQRYREQNDALPLTERQSIIDQKLSDLSAAATRAKTLRIEKEALYRQIAAIEHDRAALDSFSAVLSNSYIQQLKTQLVDLQRQQAQLSDRLGDRHPDLIRVRTAIEGAEAKLGTEVAKVVQSLRTDYLAAQAQERTLTGAFETQKREALAFDRQAIEGNVLRRDAESNRQLYDALLQRTKETGLVGELKPNNIRVVDQAEVPQAPVSPDKLQALALALAGGALLAVGLAFFFEYLDDRIKTPDEIRTHFGLSTLGMVPRIAAKQLGPQPLISNGVPPNFAEAFSAIRTSVLFSSGDAGSAPARTVLVTSTTPGEGKTISASNLAIGLAQVGDRVLLVDCDMRRPTVHTMFGLEQEPGLSDLLAGTAHAKDVMHVSSIAGLWVLPAGNPPSNPAEQLASKRFRRFLASLDEHFDWVVLDSPPVLAVTDAALLAHMVHGIVFVIGADMTSRPAGVTAIERLESAGGHFIGAILNQVNLKRHGYYYSPYYRQAYADYYRHAGSH